MAKAKASIPLAITIGAVGGLLVLAGTAVGGVVSVRALPVYLLIGSSAGSLPEPAADPPALLPRGAR